MSIHNNETRASYGKIKGFVCPSGATWHVTGLIIGGVVGVRVEDEGGNTTSLRWERGTGWIERGTGGKSNKTTWMWILGAPQPTTEEIDTMRIQDREQIERLIASDEDLIILSGEGNVGVSEQYTGKRTVRAIMSRLTRERCGGDRWARVDTEDAIALLEQI